MIESNGTLSFGDYRPTAGALLFCLNNPMTVNVLRELDDQGLHASRMSACAELVWRGNLFRRVCYAPLYDPFQITPTAEHMREPLPLEKGAIEIRLPQGACGDIESILVACEDSTVHFVVDYGKTCEETRTPAHMIINFYRTETLGEILQLIESGHTDTTHVRRALAALVIVGSYFSKHEKYLGILEEGAK